MATFEHRMETLPAIEDREAMVRALDALSRDGWELCHMEGGIKRDKTFVTIAIMRREVHDGPEV